jgi:hypothetical protein
VRFPMSDLSAVPSMSNGARQGSRRQVRVRIRRFLPKDAAKAKDCHN